MWSTSRPVLSHSANPAASSAGHRVGPNPGNTQFLRHHARRLLDCVRTGNTSASLPVMRRLLASGAVKVTGLSALREARASIQLKHVLNMLATELGYPGWDACKAVADTRGPEAIDRYHFDAGAFGDFEKTWFSIAAQAREWQREHGGYIVGYGDQAVAILWREHGQ